MGRRLAVLGVLGALSVASAATQAAPSAALVADDVCVPGGGDDACALSALQTRSTGAQAASGALQAEGRAGELPPTTKRIEDARGTWVYDEQTFYDQHPISPSQKKEWSEHPERGKEHTELWSTSCHTWNGYFWPRVSFWAQEFKKRAKVAGDDEEKLAKLSKWTGQAAFAACLPPFDPRHGTPWAKPVSEWMMKVHQSDDLEMPKLTDPFFMLRSAQMMMVPQCQWWVTSLMCDLVYWVDKMQGDKKWEEGSFCWEKVQHPGYGFTIQGLNMSAQLDLPARPAEIPDDIHTHPEYLQCQDHNLDENDMEYYKAMCPFGGHYPDGMLGLTTWGEGAPAEARPEILKCSAKLKLPIPCDAPQAVWAWSPEIDLMRAPYWEKFATVLTNVSEKLVMSIIGD